MPPHLKGLSWIIRDSQNGVTDTLAIPHAWLRFSHISQQWALVGTTQWYYVHNQIPYRYYSTSITASTYCYYAYFFLWQKARSELLTKLQIHDLNSHPELISHHAMKQNTVFLQRIYWKEILKTWNLFQLSVNSIRCIQYKVCTRGQLSNKLSNSPKLAILNKLVLVFKIFAVVTNEFQQR